jgi:ribose transport system substrate-binding protein
MCLLIIIQLLSVSRDGASAGPSDEQPIYTFGYNNFGQGAYPLDLNERETAYALESIGMKIQVVNNEFTVDKLINDAQNLIASEVDGLVLWVASDTLYPAFSKLSENNRMPFVLGDKYPLTEDTIAMLRENPYFVGGISTPDILCGAQVAELALGDGHKTALLVGAAIGDTNHDKRIQGFTEAFESGGGKVLGVVRCADPSEAVQKSGDLLSAHRDADCLLGSGGDYQIGALNAMESMNITMPIYGIDIDPLVVEAMKKGKIIAANGAAGPYCAGIAAPLLVNYLDGHPILDENGNAPMSDQLSFIMVTAETADDYEKYWLKRHPFLEEEYRNLCYRYNPDVTWQDYVNLIESYSFENRVEVLGAIN